MEDHERATGPWEIEWITLPSIFTLAAGALKQAVFVLEGLEVHVDGMKKNLDLTHGLIVAEAVMMGLAPKLGRDRAHDLVYELCHKAGNEGTPLADLLQQNKEISSQLGADEIKKLSDPTGYLGVAGTMVDRVLQAG
jgi:3-carboxy-cis,cis-muconate cycloisomerase